MRLSNDQIRKRLGIEKKVFYTQEKLQETIEKSKTAFYENEAEDCISRMEFLYQQSRYIKKRWWVLQGILLFWLWFILQQVNSSFYVQRCMGVAASLFAVLLLPELWKNRNANALEIEGVSYYSLRQIYSARIFAFALVDFLLLCTFTLLAVLNGKVLVEEIMIQFFLPYIVACCICFRVLASSKAGSEVFAISLCIVWCAIWTQIVLSEKVYGAVSLQIWIIMTIASVFYLGYCIYKEQNSCKRIWE